MIIGNLIHVLILVIRNGMNIPGLGTVSVDSKTRNIKVVKLQPVNKETIDMLVDLGL